MKFILLKEDTYDKMMKYAEMDKALKKKVGMPNTLAEIMITWAIENRSKDDPSIRMSNAAYEKMMELSKMLRIKDPEALADDLLYVFFERRIEELKGERA